MDFHMSFDFKEESGGSPAPGHRPYRPQSSSPRLSPCLLAAWVLGVGRCTLTSVCFAVGLFCGVLVERRWDAADPIIGTDSITTPVGCLDTRTRYCNSGRQVEQLPNSCFVHFPGIIIGFYSSCLYWSVKCPQHNP